MVKLQEVEETDEQLVFRMSALPMIGHMGLMMFTAAILTVSLTLFARRWIGLFFSFAFITMPGTVCTLCALWGVFNARTFTFAFRRATAEFSAVAGNAELQIPFSQITLLYVERDCDSGGSGLFGGGSAPTFAATLLLIDGQRFHLEGGVAITGSGMGPPELHASCSKIREFLRLSEGPLPILEMTKAAKPEPDANDHAAHDRLSRWLSCHGICPKLEPALYEHNWLVPPAGVSVPGPAIRPLGGHGEYGRQVSLSAMQRQASYGQPQSSPGQRNSRNSWEGQRPTRQVSSGTPMADGPVVMGRVAGAPQPRFLEVVVPEGMQGQNMVVMTPDGLQLSVTVPAEAVSGEPIRLQY